MGTHSYVERVVDLLDPSLNVLHGIEEDEAHARALSGDPSAVRVAQAHEFLDRLGLGLLFEAIEAGDARLDLDETLRVIEDYKPLDVECAAVGLRLCRGIRERYPEWGFIADDDGGDDGLADGEAAWWRLLADYPSIREQFGAARATSPFVHTPRNVHRTAAATGPNWALLPSAAPAVTGDGAEVGS